MNQAEIHKFFECLGEVWRDISGIEFLMRCAIAKKDGDIDKLPVAPYDKGKTYNQYPKSFSDLSFENVTIKFNKRFPEIRIPNEIIQLRNAMAHGVISEINNDGITRLIKFREQKEERKLKVEFSLNLDLKTLEQLRQSIHELRRYVILEINKK